APTAAAPAGGRANLLADIQRGKELKAVDAAADGLPELDGMSEEGKGNLANTLANALALRRADMVASDHEEDDGGWDEWDEDM
ncbi:MAG: WH2 domain-containing protein, partial [archaeon]|nr:WH2 domain-containing protein [archaeon]